MASNQTNEATLRTAICRMPPGTVVSCNTCGRSFNLSPSQIKRRDRMCTPCVTAGRARRGKPKTNLRSARRRRAERVVVAVQKAIKRGRLVRKPCEVCGETTLVVAHHEDYTKRFDVKWLCRIHHAAEHKALAARGWVSNL